MRVRVNTLLVSCILLTIATGMQLPSAGIIVFINTPNDFRIQSAGYGALAIIVVLVFVTWTGLFKSDRRAWFIILVIALIWEYPIFPRLYFKHFGLSFPLGVVEDLAFIGMRDTVDLELLSGIYGFLMTIAALALAARPVFWSKGVWLGRRAVTAIMALLTLLLVVGTWVRLRESAIPPRLLNTFMVPLPAPPQPLPQQRPTLPNCDPSVCNCPK
jgi:hypothetical protein